MVSIFHGEQDKEKELQLEQIDADLRKAQAAEIIKQLVCPRSTLQ